MAVARRPRHAGILRPSRQARCAGFAGGGVPRAPGPHLLVERPAERAARALLRSLEWPGATIADVPPRDAHGPDPGVRLARARADQAQVARRLSLQRTAEGLRLAESDTVAGKVVLLPSLG